MTDSTIATGKDAWVLSSSPNKAHPQPKRPRLTGGIARAFVSLPLKQQVAGRSVQSAILSCPVRGSWAAQTLTVHAVTEAWKPRDVTWNDAPDVGASVSEAQPALSAGERFEVDITSLVQAIAAGADDFGFRVSTSDAGTNRLFGFASGDESWQVDIEFADSPEAPVPLSPLGGAVGIEPVVSWDYTAGGGDDDAEQAASRVWVNTSPTQTGAVDSGWLANELPEFDLADLAGWAPVAGTTYYWQVQTRDGALSESEPSDWASFTYQPYVSGTIDSPGAGTVWDPTPTIAFSVTGGVVKQYRLRVLSDATGKQRYASGWTTVADLTSVTRTLPEKWNGKRVHVDDRTYRLEVDIRDRLDREATGADPGFLRLSTTYSFDDDATPTPVSDLLVAQIGDSPRTRWTWVRPLGDTRAWVMGVGNRVLARLDPDEVETASTTHSWTCDQLAAYVNNHCWVKAIDDTSGKQTEPSPEYVFNFPLKGVWLLGEDSEVTLDGLDVGGFVNSDSRAIYSPLGLEHDVDIVYALRGLTGSFVGGVSSSRGRDWEADLATLRAMRSDTDEPVRLAYGTVNVPMILRNVSPGLPHPDMLPHNMKHTVTFEAHQVDEFGDD
jgi:hypothetical protein